jgi:hypothetical protein
MCVCVCVCVEPRPPHSCFASRSFRVLLVTICLTNGRAEGGFRTTVWRPHAENSVGGEPGVAGNMQRTTSFTIRSHPASHGGRYIYIYIYMLFLFYVLILFHFTPQVLVLNQETDGCLWFTINKKMTCLYQLAIMFSLSNSLSARSSIKICSSCEVHHNLCL